MFDPLFSIEKEVIIISGCSGQLGAQYTKIFLERGAKVAGLDIESSKNIYDFSVKYPANYRFFLCDVTQSQSLKKTLESICIFLGEPTVLINNAALDSPPNTPLEETGPFENYPDSSWDRVMEVNVKGVYLACKVFGAAMAVNKHGSIINISSIYGVVSPDQAIYQYRRERGENFYKPIAYSVSKSALLNLTRYLAVYWAKPEVRVNTLVLAGVENNQDKEFKKAYCDRIPVGRMAESTEYNGAILFLASQASKYMTGSTLVVDDGWTAV